MSDDTESKGLSPLSAGGLAIAVVGTALLIGARSGPTPDHPKTRRWYRRLTKPGFTPPSLVFPIAWTGIQSALAYGGYRLLRRSPSPERTAALALWAGNQIGIAGWTEVFFGQRAPGWGTIASAALGANAIGFVAVAKPVDRTAATLGVPLVAWVGFATMLSEEIWRRNDPPPAPDHGA